MKNKIQQIKNNPSFINPFSNFEIKKSTTKKIISSFHQNKLKSSHLRKSQILKIKKEGKEFQFLHSTITNNIISHSNTLKKKAKVKQIILGKKDINVNNFYKIRKEIYKNLKNTYKGPYILHLIKKGYYKNKQKEDYPIYYNYYQICNMMNKKKFKLSISYNEFLLFYNNQEYLMKYLVTNEQYIIMNYLLYNVYNRDKCVIADNPKKILKDDQIKAMFSQLVKNNYLFEGTMEILDNIGVYFRMSFSNSGKNIIFLEKLKPVVYPKIYYLYAKDIPKKLLPNCIPNLFPVLKEKIKYLVIYLKSKKYNKIKRIEYLADEKDLKDLELDTNSNTFNKIIKNNNNENSNIIKSSEDSNKLDENFVDYISSSSDKEDISQNKISIEQVNSHYNPNKKYLVDHDINDIELLIDKMTIALQKIENPRKTKKRATIRESKNFIFSKEIKGYYSFSKENEKNKVIQNKKKENEENSFIKNKIMMNNKKFFEKISKKEFFQTSLKGKDAINNKNKKSKFSSRAISSKITKNREIRNSINKYKVLKKLNMKIDSNNRQNNPNNSLYLLPSFTNKKKFLTNKAKNDLTLPNMFNISYLKNKKASSFKNKNNIKKKKNVEFCPEQENNSNSIIKFSSFENSFNSDNNPLNNDEIKNEKPYNNFSMNDIFSYNLIEQKQLNYNFRKTYNNYFGNKKYKIKKFPSLKEFENIYEKIKDLGLLPKTKMFFRGNKYRAFSNFSGNNSYQNKIFNEWEEKKNQEIKIKSEYFYMNLKKKIKEENKQKKNIFKNLTTMKEIVKCPNIYY